MAKKTGYGIASLILGILSIILFLLPIIGLISGILGIVFSIKQKRISPTGMATAGLVTSIIGSVFSGIINLVYLIAVNPNYFS